MKLIDILKPEYIKIPLEGNSKEEIIFELIEVLHQQQLFSEAEPIFQAVMEREKIMTTGVGRGIAIPHCKKSDCQEFAIALGIQPSGSDFNAIDNQPVKVIFLLIGPEDNPSMHIRLLSRISRLISKNSLRDQLIACKKSQQAYMILKEEEEKYFMSN
jgi:PTS system fructose-specific IIC component